jgi:hypothetical protein
MAKTATTTTADAALLVKKRKYIGVPINLGSNRVSYVSVRGDVLDYFGIKEPTAAEQKMLEVVKKTTGKINRFGAGLGDTSPTEVATDTTIRFYRPPTLGSSGSGRRVIVPTELVHSGKTTVRKVTMHFPSLATLAVISDWLYTNCATHKPGYFISPSGRRLLVVGKGTITDLNPGNSTPAAAP